MDYPSTCGVRARRVPFWGAVFALLVALAMLLPAGSAFAQGQGKRIMLYTGTTGFRHTDGINGGRPIVQGRLEALGYTIDWEDCNSRGQLEFNILPSNCNPRKQEPAHLHD